MPHLSWNEVRDRAVRFSREHARDRSESAETQAFTYIEDLTRAQCWEEFPRQTLIPLLH